MSANVGFVPTSSGAYRTQQRVRVISLAIAALLGSLVCALLVIVLDLGAVALLLGIAMLITALVRPRIAVYVLLALVLTFEAGSVDPLMAVGLYIHAGLTTSAGLSGASISPLELLIVVAILGWLMRGVMLGSLAFRAGRLAVPVVLLAALMVIGLMRGLIAGGDANIALWEIRYLAYAVALYFLAANVIRSRADVRTLLGVALVSAAAFAVEGAYRYFALASFSSTYVPADLAYAHEDAVFVASLILLVLTQLIFGAPAWQRVFGLLALPVAAFAMLAMQRRAGFIGLFLGLALLALIVLITRPGVFVLLGVPLIVLGTLYLAVFWNDPGLLGQPARAIRSLSQPDARDASSNFYRYLESINVSSTIHQDPLLGVGFGRQFTFFVSMPSLSWWPFWHYEPHNSVLWTWLKMGVAGFVAFLFVIGSAVVRAANLARTMRIPELRTFAIFALVSVIGTLVFSYVDLGLVTGRITAFLGVTLGVLSVLEDLT